VVEATYRERVLYVDVVVSHLCQHIARQFIGWYCWILAFYIMTCVIIHVLNEIGIVVYFHSMPLILSPHSFFASTLQSSEIYMI